MDFLAIIIVLGMLQIWGSLTPYQNDHVFDRWHAWCVTTFRSPPWAYGALLIVPCVVLMVVMAVMADWLWHGVGLALTVLVLCYAVGRGEYNRHLQAYITEWQSGSRERAMFALQGLCDGALTGCLEFDPNADDAKAHQRAMQVMLLAALRRLFTVLFWFVFVGVEASLLYRLALLAQARPMIRGVVLNPVEQAYQDKTIGMIARIMEWPAARLLALTFVVQVRVADVLRIWWHNALSLDVSGVDVLYRCAAEALAITPELSASDREALTSVDVEEQTRGLQLLLNRSLIVLVVLTGIYWLV
ncbi:Uncharacterised protein [BD1-7 clade bacterium]|uniref:AmpE protein n=1 Tax=BD1-7 clade bacterium TaxID=2029982 RepID=A0A5S9QBP9_9GAMM|nr:Uncharacterised protein [BD1-7 clade bacterium]CAA0115656.1 Uncharacterised protein [BD1-7 clade bacterium]